MTIPLYRGFSTARFLQTRKTFAITNQETVKADLLNHIYTVKGERPHRPEFGTRIPLLAFEPLDDKTIKIIRDDLRQVFEFDPRVDLLDMAVMAAPDNNAIIAYVDVFYKELNVKETLKLEFDVNR